MPKKNSALLQKVSSLLKSSIFMAKLREPLIPKMIILLKKTGKLKKLKKLKPYNYSYYNYVKDYEFSPSSTPLMEFRRKARKGRLSFGKLKSNLWFSSACLGRGRKEMCCLEMGMQPLPLIESAIGRELTRTVDLSDSGSGDDESVDERAERFIQRFYEEMRRQRQESTLQLLQMS